MAQLQIQTSSNQNQLQIRINYPPNPQLQHNFTLTLTLHQQNISNRTESLTYKKVFHSQQREILITDLKYSCMYKLTVINKYGMGANVQEKTKNVFVYTPARRDPEDNDQGYNEDGEGLNGRNTTWRGRNQSVQGNRQNIMRNYQEDNREYNRKLAKTRPKKKITHNNNQLCNSELLVKTLAQSNHIVNKNMAHKYMLESRKCRNVKQFINEKNGNRINRQEVGDKRMLVIQSKLLFSEIYKYRDGCKFFENNWCMGPFYSFDANQKDIRRQ